MKKLLIIALLTISAFSATTKGGYGACISEAYYDEWVGSDRQGKLFLLNKTCFVLKAGFSYTMLDRGWSRSKIRLFIGDGGIILWTANENL